MSSHDLRTSSRRPSNTTGRTDTSHSPPSTSPSGSHHSFPRSPSNQFPTHRRTDSRRPAIALPSPQQQSAADAEGIGALPPSSGEPPAKKGHRRGASWTAKFGSGNWKSLAGFGGGTDKEDLRRDRLNSSATRGANSGKMMSLEFDRFLDERFKADEYIQSTLHSNNEEGVRQFYTLLNDAKESAAQDLQRNVFKNYNEFVVISKEISKLETDMLYLRGLLTELKSVHDGQTSDPIDSNEQSFKGPMQVRTNSVDAEDGMKKAQINLLWETVEGAQKLLPPSTSHIFLRESPSFHEVDPKNPQLKQPVHLYLLNTCLLVASKKKRGFSFIGGMGMRGVPDFGSSKKLVAEKCWNLSEIAVIDVKDTYDITNAFKIMKHPHQYIYRCDSLQEKKSWVSHLKKAIDEYVAENRAENDVGEMDAFEKPRRPSNTPRSKTKDLTPADIKWLMDLLDDLDVFIAHREFDEAVDAVTKAKALLSSLPSETQRTMQFRRQLDIRVQKLSKVISIDLANPQLNKSNVKMNINRLLKLELHDQARTIFLNARSAIIKQRVRQLKFEGEISSYISELAFVVFTLIKNSCDWYNSSFREPGMASGFVKWAKSELENYVMIFKRQVFDNQQRFQVIADCIRTTDDQLSSLKESYEQRCAEVIAKSVAEDTYVPMKQPGDGSGIRTDSQAERERESLGTTLPITKCMVKFYQTMVEFLSDTSTLLSPSLYTTSIGSICSLFDAYLNWELQVVNEKDLKEEQLFPVLYNSIYTIQDFLPQIASRLSRHFERPIPELDSLRQRLQPTLEAIEQAVAKKRVRVITGSIYNFNNINLESNEPIKNDANPSTAMQKLISTINKVGSEIDPSAEPKRVMEFMIESVFRFLNDASNWETSSGPRKFGSEGVSQLVLDIHFFQKVCTDFMTEFSCDSAQDVCEKSLKMLLTQNPKAAASLKDFQ
ncbi:hypothetical protein BKA69DRAFT_272200 [Paraphysoderma sedebokerense]|nr:hypothetical protein BKA69DRAFT_272200 [Paraphysoderma sedebokerense]